MNNESNLTVNTIMLLDNGSVRVNAQLALRQLSKKLSNQVRQTIHPVSVLHSNKISDKDVSENLNNIKPNVFYDFIHEQLELGQRHFIIIPLFFGNSGALTTFSPKKIEQLKRKYGEFSVSLKPTLYPLPRGEPIIIEIFKQYINESFNNFGNSKETDFVLVDHGSPTVEVTAIRSHIANQLNTFFKGDILINEAVMERRDGKEYDFNGILLKDFLAQRIQSGAKQINVLLLFLLPGRHAGKNGDIEQIIAEAKQRHPNIAISTSPLLSEHPALLSCLSKRLFEI